MPKIVPASLQVKVIDMMMAKSEDGKPLYDQGDIQRETGLSKPFIKKMAIEIGYQFPRNGIELVGSTCMCVNCGILFRRAQSKIDRAKNKFCDENCKEAWTKGSNHPMWKTGKTAASFSTWIKNQAKYKEWRKAALEKAEFRCEISGRTDSLQVHHIFMKAEDINPEKALDPNNAMVVNDKVHRRIHTLIRKGFGFEESIEILKERYKKAREKILEKEKE